MCPFVLIGILLEECPSATIVFYDEWVGPKMSRWRFKPAKTAEIPPVILFEQELIGCSDSDSPMLDYGPREQSPNCLPAHQGSQPVDHLDIRRFPIDLLLPLVRN